MDGCNRQYDHMLRLHTDLATKQVIGLASEIVTVRPSAISGISNPGCPRGEAVLTQCRRSCLRHPDEAWNAFVFTEAGTCKCVYVDPNFPRENIKESDTTMVAYIVPGNNRNYGSELIRSSFTFYLITNSQKVEYFGFRHYSYFIPIPL